MMQEASAGEDWWDMIWLELGRGVVDRHHSFHTPVLCTVSPAGEPECRMVVLRRVQKSTMQLCCHTDWRSPKVESINLHPKVSWLLYLPEKKLQLRVAAHAAVLNEGATVDATWAKTSPSSRRCYLAIESPGQPLAEARSSLPEEFQTQRPTPGESEDGRKNFAVITTTAFAVDCLQLDAQGHRRCRFLLDAEGHWQQTWIAP
jgi:pyridoxamine 5'-phosphate oxidase